MNGDAAPLLATEPEASLSSRTAWPGIHASVTLF